MMAKIQQAVNRLAKAIIYEDRQTQIDRAKEVIDLLWLFIQEVEMKKE